MATKRAKDLDSQCIAGAVLVSVSVALLAVQALNPCTILGGILYSFIGLSVVGRSYSGKKLFSELNEKALLATRNTICCYFEDGSAVRVLLEMVFAYALYSCSYKVPKSIDHKPKIVSTASPSFTKKLLMSIRKEFPNILNKSGGNTSLMTMELQACIKSSIWEHLHKMGMDWISIHLLGGIRGLKDLYNSVWKNLIGLKVIKSEFQGVQSKQTNNNRPLSLQTKRKQLPRQLRLCYGVISSLLSSQTLLYKTDISVVYRTLISVAIIVTNMIAFRFTVHPSQLAWLRNLLTVRLISISLKKFKSD